MGRRIALSVAFIGFNLMACCCGGGDQAKPEDQVKIPFPPQNEIEFRDRFGNADNISAVGNSRVVSYWTSQVEIVYKRSGNSMVFSRFQDPETLAEISEHEVLVRMYGRDSLRKKLVADAREEAKKKSEKK